jgi:hypothetical protein
MYIALDGVFGTTCFAGFRGELDDPEATVGDFAGGFCACDTTRLRASGFAVAIGGGNGEIDMDVIEAVCA